MSFISKLSKNLSPVSKIIKQTGLDRDLSNSISKKLLGNGLSTSGLGNVSNHITDTLVSGAEAGFFSQNNTGPFRASENELFEGRDSFFVDSEKYVNEVSPEGKIEGKSQDATGLTYPPDIGEYYMGFKFMKYERPNPLKPANVVDPYLIYLPLPRNLEERHDTDWTTQAQGLLGGTINQSQVDNSGIDSGELLAQGGYAGAAAVSGTIANIPFIGPTLSTNESLNMAGQALGAVPNPNLAVIFQGPVLREFGFGWKFHPQTADESDLIRNIINEFRKRMLPNRAAAGSNLVLGYPQMVEVKLYPDDYLYKMKRCVVKNISVNYAAEGIPSFFGGTKAPTFIEFAVYLQEIEYFLSEDFGGKSGNGIKDRAKEIFNEIRGVESDTQSLTAKPEEQPPSE